MSSVTLAFSLSQVVLSLSSFAEIDMAAAGVVSGIKRRLAASASAAAAGTSDVAAPGSKRLRSADTVPSPPPPTDSKPDSLARARAELNAMGYSRVPKMRTIEALAEALRSWTRPWTSQIHDILAYTIAGDASNPLPRCRRVYESPAQFAWSMLESLGDNEADMRYEAESEATTTTPKFRSEWSEADAKAAVALLRPFAGVGEEPHNRGEIYLELCDELPWLAAEVLADQSFLRSHQFSPGALTSLLSTTSSRMPKYDPNDKDHVARLRLVKQFADAMPAERLNAEEDHPLLVAAVHVESFQADPATWRTLLTSWLPPCGTRMRIGGVRVRWTDGMQRYSMSMPSTFGALPTTSMLQPDEKEPVRKDLTDALRMLVPLPPPNLERVTEGNIERHQLIVGGVDALMAQHRKDCDETCALIGESTSTSVGAVAPLVILTLAYLFDAAYLPDTRRPAAAAAAAAFTDAASAVTPKPPAAAAAAAADSMSD